MRALLTRFLNGSVHGLGIAAAVVLVAQAYALSVPTFTGVSGSNPVNFPAALADLNAVINAINAAVQMNFGATTNSNAGEPQFTNPTAFAANAGVATAMSSVGPVGSHTTIQEWLTIVNASGTLRYAPLF